MKTEIINCSPFFQNFFLINEKRKLAFVCISKNGCVTLKRSVIFDDTEKDIQDEGQLHNMIGYSEKSKYLVPIDKMKEFEMTHGNYKKVAIYRDPVDRFLSVYKFFILDKNYRTYFHYLGFYQKCTLDDFIEFARKELEKSSLFQDEHIRLQSDYYSDSDVDLVIDIKDMTKYLKSEGIEFKDNKIINKSHSEIQVSPNQRQQILDLVMRDYDIKLKGNYEEDNTNNPL